MARVYGLRRTLTPSSWEGKCFSPGGDYVVTVKNRIRVNYGKGRLKGLADYAILVALILA